MAFNTAGFNENRKDADSVLLKDFSTLSSKTKTSTAIASSTKTFGAISENGGKPFVEVGG